MNLRAYTLFTNASTSPEIGAIELTLPANAGYEVVSEVFVDNFASGSDTITIEIQGKADSDSGWAILATVSEGDLSAASGTLGTKLVSHRSMPYMRAQTLVLGSVALGDVHVKLIAP